MASSAELLRRGGVCGELIARHDWSSTAVGDVATWPPALRAMVANLLHTRQPMLLFWGPELIQFYNDAFVPSFGRGKHPAAMGQPARECWTDAWPVIGAQIEAVMSRGEPAWFEDALVPIYRNGRMEEVFWTYSYSPAYDDSGAIQGTLVIVTEMTGRVLAARRLELLAALGAALSTVTSYDDTFDVLGRVGTHNTADIPFLLVRTGDATYRFGITEADAATVIAVAAADAPSRELREVALVNGVPGPVWPEPVERAVAASVGHKSHTVIVGLSPRLPFDDGYRSFIAQVVEQVGSALRRIDKANAIREAQRQRDDLLMHAPVATALLTGPDHVFQLANPLYCKIVGRDPVGKPLREALPELRETEVPAVFDRVYQTGEPLVLAEQLVALDRENTGKVEDAWFSYTLEPLRDERDAVYGLMVVAIDITDQVHARRVLQDANRAKDDFLAMLGHELRNPLAPIVTALELMTENEANVAQARTVIDRQVRHVIRLVDDLLDISRITRGLITLQRRDIELADVVASAVEHTSHLVEQRGHRIVVETRRGVLVSGDEARLVQIVSNLITNAARYTPNGGEIRVVLTVDGKHAQLAITDTGVGMEAELLPRVFDLFVQGARAERGEGGLGLGLAIVKNLVQLHGGEVSAHSDGPGTGSTFSVRFALVEAKEANIVAPEARRTSVERRRVLVVDDNEDAANLLGEIARTRGHDVAVVHDPAGALAALETFSPEVAVLDIGLPGMDGYELASRLRSVCPDCRLIALTGYGQSKDRERALDAGFSAHLVKPVRINVLLDMIAS